MICNGGGLCVLQSLEKENKNKIKYEQRALPFFPETHIHHLRVTKKIISLYNVKIY